MNGAAPGLRQPCCRFGVGAALLPEVDSRLYAELFDSAVPVPSTPAGLASESGSRLSQFRDAAPHYRAALFFALLASFVFVSCGKQKAAKSTVEAPKPASASPVPAVSDSRLDAEISRALTPTAAERNDALADRAEDILDQYPNKNVTELLNVPEVNESLKVALTKLAENKALQNQINSTVALAAQMQGLNGVPGSTRLDLDTSSYDHARKSRLLQVVLSEDPRRIAGFIAQEIGEAVPELSFEGVDRASNGVAIRENAPPQK